MRFQIEKCKRILIVKLSSIGDVVMTTPVAKALRQAMPDAYIAWVVEDRAKDVLIGNPYLDEIIIWNRNSTSPSLRKRASGLVLGLAKLAPILRSKNFDLAIDFQGLLRSGLVTGLSRAPFRVGYDNAREGAGMFYNMRLPSRALKVRGPQQYLNMLSVLNVFSTDLDMHMPVTAEDRAFAEEFVSRENGAAKPMVALCPATTWPHKHWTESGWAELADALSLGHGAAPVFMGSPADTQLVGRIQSMMKFKAASAVGKTTLNQAAAIIESSDLVVAVDTGLLHISMALDRPAVGIFGPTRWQHLPKKDNFVVAAKQLACMPCMRHPTCKKYDCMISLTTQEVRAKAEPWLAKKPAEAIGEVQLRPIRTLHVETGMHSLGGPAQVVYLMTGLRDRGHEVVLVCPKGSSVYRHATDAGLEVIAVPLRTDLDLSFVLRLYKIVKRLKPDLVHLHSRRGADIMGGLAARAAKAPTVILSRRIDNPVRHNFVSKLKYGPLCDHIIAISDGVSNALTEGRVDPSKITRVHSAIDAKRYQVEGVQSSIRSELGIGGKTNIIAIIAQLIDRKGHRFLFQAAPKILEEFPDTVFLVLGEGRLEKELHDLAESLGIRDKVVFAGFRDDIPEILSVVTLLVHPAIMEGLGVSILQAMSAGVPVIATNVGGIPEAVRHDVSGILIPPRDSDAISSAVKRLLSSPDLRASMGTASRRIVESEFSVDGMVEGVLTVYRSILKQ